VPAVLSVLRVVVRLLRVLLVLVRLLRVLLVRVHTGYDRYGYRSGR
jgi:hypothetical protein